MGIISIRLATLSDLPRLDRLARRHTNELGWVKRVRLQSAIEKSGLLIEENSGAFCEFCRRDGWGVVSTICVPLIARGKGIGTALLKEVGYPIRLKCPDGLPSNGFYLQAGFKLVKRDRSKNHILNVWEKEEDVHSNEDLPV